MIFQRYERYKLYEACLKDIFVLTFSDKKIRLNFCLSLIVLVVGVILNLALPLILKKIIDCFALPNSSLIALTLPLYGFIWMVCQIFVHVRTVLVYKIEQRLTFSLGMKVLSHLFGLSVSYFINQQPGALTNIIRRAQQNVPHIVLGLFFHVLHSHQRSYQPH